MSCYCLKHPAGQSEWESQLFVRVLETVGKVSCYCLKHPAGQSEWDPQLLVRVLETVGNVATVQYRPQGTMPQPKVRSLLS